MFLGLRQLVHQPMRLLSAILGITFAVILVFVQLEFREAIYQSAVRYHNAMDYDLVMLSPKTDYLIAARQFPRTRLFQAGGVAGVESVAPVYLDRGSWRNPVQRSTTRTIFMVGLDPEDRGFDRLLTPGQRERIKLRDHLVFDRMGRPEYGPVVETLADEGSVETAINDREIVIDSLYAVGTSFGLDGGVVSSDLNFLRVFPDRKFSAIDLGLIHLRADADPKKVQAELRGNLPNDVLVMTPEEFRAKEIRYWNKTTPVGYLFAFGAVIGLVVGLIIVYQILFADVQDHLQEYATLKAIGYGHGYLQGVVLQEAITLAVCGFLPGAAISAFVFSRAVEATRLPLEMTQENALNVFVMTLLMCCASGIFALRKLGSADPAEVFG